MGMISSATSKVTDYTLLATWRPLALSSSAWPRRRIALRPQDTTSTWRSTCLKKQRAREEHGELKAHQAENADAAGNGKAADKASNTQAAAQAAGAADSCAQSRDENHVVGTAHQLNSGAANTSEAHEEPNTVADAGSSAHCAGTSGAAGEESSCTHLVHGWWWLWLFGTLVGTWECIFWCSILSTSLCYLAVWAVGPTCYMSTTLVDIAALCSADGDEDRPRKNRSTSHYKDQQILGPDAKS